MQKLRSVQIPLSLTNNFCWCKPNDYDGFSYGRDCFYDWCKRIGCPILQAISNQYLALGLMNGLAIVALAIIFDRITQEYGNRIQRHRGITKK
jgi:glycine betaine/proline transport system permease protein